MKEVTRNFMLYLAADKLVTEKLRRHWLLDEEENVVYVSGSLEECLEYLVENGQNSVRALIGLTECDIIIGKKLSEEEAESWLK